MCHQSFAWQNPHMCSFHSTANVPSLHIVPLHQYIVIIYMLCLLCWNLVCRWMVFSYVLGFYHMYTTSRSRAGLIGIYLLKKSPSIVGRKTVCQKDVLSPCPGHGHVNALCNVCSSPFIINTKGFHACIHLNESGMAWVLCSHSFRNAPFLLSTIMRMKSFDFDQYDFSILGQ